MEDKWLLLRGLGRERAHWFEFPALLQRSTGGEVFCVDLPGTGTEYRRPAPWTIEGNARDVLSRLQARPDWLRTRLWIFGISLGGMVALDLASRLDTRLGGIVIANSSSSLCPAQQRFRLGAVPMLASALVTADVKKREQRILRVTSNRGAEKDEALLLRAANVYRQRPMSKRSVLSQLMAASRFQLPMRLKAPLLVLCSRADRLVDPRCSHRIATHYHATCSEHPEAGHDVALDDPAWVCAQLKQWQDVVSALSSQDGRAREASG